jgi:hypothetical protein
VGFSPHGDTLVVTPGRCSGRECDPRFYRVDATDGSLRLRDADAAAGNKPIDMAAALGGQYLYILNAGDASVSGFRISPYGGLQDLGKLGDLPPLFAQGIAVRRSDGSWKKDYCSFKHTYPLLPSPVTSRDGRALPTHGTAGGKRNDLKLLFKGYKPFQKSDFG